MTREFRRISSWQDKSYVKIKTSGRHAGLFVCGLRGKHIVSRVCSSFLYIIYAIQMYTLAWRLPCQIWPVAHVDNSLLTLFSKQTTVTIKYCHGIYNKRFCRYLHVIFRPRTVVANFMYLITQKKFVFFTPSTMQMFYFRKILYPATHIQINNLFYFIFLLNLNLSQRHSHFPYPLHISIEWF